jgi:hypothetical protein
MDATSPAAAEERPPLSQAEIAADLDLDQLQQRLLRFAAGHYRDRQVPPRAATYGRAARLALLGERASRGQALFNPADDILRLDAP